MASDWAASNSLEGILQAKGEAMADRLKLGKGKFI
jgi:hypothetical protein